MRSLLLADLTVFAVALVATLLLTPLAIRLSRRVGAIAHPNERSVHTRPTPVLGGSAMLAGLILAFGAAAVLPPLRDAVRIDNQAFGIVAASLVIVLVFTIDDLRDLSPPAKVAGLVLAASVLFIFGVTMTYFRIPFLGVVVLSSDVAPLVTALWVVVLCNAMNLIDGLDGLAAGVAGLAAAAMFIFAARMQYLGLLDESSLAPVVCAAAAGIAFGFLRWNFSPAKIFMGDAGAMLLGLLLAAATMLTGGRVNDQFSGQSFFFFVPLLIPVVILGIPIADVLFSMGRRLLRGQGIATADRGHLHHRLIELGHGPRRAVGMVYAWTILLAAVALVPTFAPAEGQALANRLVPFVLAALALLLYAIFHPGNPKLAHLWTRQGGRHVAPRGTSVPQGRWRPNSDPEESAALSTATSPASGVAGGPDRASPNHAAPGRGRSHRTAVRERVGPRRVRATVVSPPSSGDAGGAAGRSVTGSGTGDPGDAEPSGKL